MGIKWTKDLNTGIDVIDGQHRRIVDYINTLEKADPRDSKAIGSVLNELADYTISHFAFEETLQEEAGYPMAKPHKAVHDTFIKRIGHYQERHQKGEDVTKQLNEMLCTWLIHHIKRDDMAYVKMVQISLNKKMANDTEENGWFGRTLKKFFK